MFALLLLAAFLGEPASSPMQTPAAALTGQEILDRAAAVWEQVTLPPFEAFTMPCREILKSGAEGSCGNSVQMRVYIRTNDGMAHVETVPKDGGLPVVLLPEGHVYGPAYAPLGFTRKLGTTQRVGSLAADPLSEFKTIAAVTVSNPAYDIQAADDTCDSQPAYHLTLSPRFSPNTHPLRALWVDQDSFQICKLTYAISFNGGVATVNYKFQQVGDPAVPMIVGIEARVPQHSLIGITYSNASEYLTDISFPASVQALP